MTAGGLRYRENDFMELLAVHLPIEALGAILIALVIACVKVGADIVKRRNGASTSVGRAFDAIKKNAGAIEKTNDNLAALTLSVQGMQTLQAVDRTNLENLTNRLEETHTDLRTLLGRGK